ncbi:MAG: VCBS repeat-containing protein [Sphingobacteriales bacterium]|nr:VCBS repeat-containing protein [Sphingobacteriales bacterium]
MHTNYSTSCFLCFVVVVFMLGNCFRSNAQTTFAPEQRLINNLNDVQFHAVADLDADGNIDVLAASYEELVWYKNNGIGGFDTRQKIIDASHVSYIAVADFDNDGDMDILFKTDTELGLWLCKNDGTNHFDNPQTAIAGNFAYAAIADLDNDGSMDIVLAANLQLLWYKNDDAGNFILQPSIATYENWASKFVIGDIDNDNDADIITSLDYNSGGDSFKNDGNGNFTLDETVLSTINWGIPYLADMDNDGDKDLIFSNMHQYASDGYLSSIRWYENSGNGSFSYEHIIFNNDSANYYAMLAGDLLIADFNNDGNNDIMYSMASIPSFSEGSVTTSWLENMGANESFYYHSIGDNSGVGNMLYIVAADFDNDGAVDICYQEEGLDYSSSGRSLIWRSVDDTGNFNTLTYVTINTYGSINTYLADVNGDGYKDILTASAKVVWYKNDGNNNFTELHIVNSINVDNAYSDNFYIADFDNDGAIDIVANTLGQIVLYKNDGSGDFTIAQTIVDNNSPLYAKVVVDADNDGAIDFLAVSTEGHNIILYHNDGTGNFNTGQIIDSNVTLGFPNELLVADLDNDGNKDIVTVLLPNNRLVWYKNNGGNNFNASQTLITFNSNVRSVCIDDLNNDNKLDIILSENNGTTLNWYRNQNASTFIQQETIESNFSMYYKIATADLDNDGYKDVIARGNNNWYKNNGVNGFGAGQFIGITDGYLGDNDKIITDDLDNDGDVDVFSTSTAYCILFFYQNLYYHGNLQGVCYYDLNQDGQYNEGEYSLSNQAIMLMPNYESNYSTTEGYYYVLANGNHSISVTPQSGWHFTTDSLVNFIASANQDTIINFGLYPNTLVSNVKPYVTSGVNDCDGQVPYYLSVINDGTNIDTLSIVSLQPDAQLLYQNATPAPDSIGINGRLYWHINSLVPTQQSNFVVWFQAPNSDSQGDTLLTIANVSSYNQLNEQTSNNSFNYQAIISCVNEPNNKQVSPLGVMAQNYTLISNADELYYTISFQNTGNDTVNKVLIIDGFLYTLDPSTFRLINSSHPVEVQFLDYATVSFTFNNILLPDSSSNEVGSHGFVMYGIKPRVPILNNTIVVNSANIFLMKMRRFPPILLGVFWFLKYLRALTPLARAMVLGLLVLILTLLLAI